MDFNKLFEKNGKGNFFSRQKRTTIYKANNKWYYAMGQGGMVKYGRKDFETPESCYQYLVQKGLI